ncbi:ABC transporter ATP-binding protein [Nesterenkonia populi]|uniref:ABC transporter ATP-binding protein n=1 Tax=Nesterenkonia populi TaxID=1591087 RepID=UPI0011BE1660|nr:ATP-binding cassette domain-containing protein [Nesterenkonia populi]
MTNLLRVEDISKSFGPVQANAEVSFTVAAGEVHALLGENGAGKSTLVKSLYGVHQPDTGRVLLREEEITIDSPSRARQIGIGLVFQDMRLIPALTVWENIALYLDEADLVLKTAEIMRRISDASDRWGLSVDPKAKISELSIGEWQRVELLKVLMGGAKLLILDEPTSVLTPTEVNALFGVVDHLKSTGVGVIIITHKLREVRQIADRVTVLRGGRAVLSDIPAQELDDDALVTAMVGRTVDPLMDERPPVAEAVPAITLDGAEVRRKDGTTALDRVDLNVLPGEILGVAGVAGNGQDELVDVLAGARTLDAGRLQIVGGTQASGRPGQFRGRGVVAVVPNPVHQFVVPGLSIAEHNALWEQAAGEPGSLSKAAGRFKERAGRVGLPVAEPHRTLADLSGGNIQRVLLTLAFSSDPVVLILAYPTRGLDVATAQQTREAILEARRAGAAVVVVSEDLDELTALSDRVVVLSEGRVSGELSRGEIDRSAIGAFMTSTEVR